MFVGMEFEVPPSALKRPMSWSRAERRVATLEEVLTSRFPETALGLGLLIKRPQEVLPLVQELKPHELRRIVIAEMEAVPDNYSLQGGSDSISQQQILAEVRRGTAFGRETINQHRYMFESLENAARSGRLKLVEELDPNAPIELPPLPY